MKVKRYVGPSVEDALNRVKYEMGKDAIILNKRKIKPGKGVAKFFRRPVYEIVAAIDQYENIPKTTFHGTNNDYKALEEKVDRLKNSIDTILNRMQHGESPYKIPDLLMPYYNILKDNDIEQDIIETIIGNVKEKINPQTTYDEEYLYFKFKQEVSSCINRVKTIELSESKPSIAVLVGPTGVGKTTTLAKLTAQYAIMMKKKVGIITCDTYRIAAVEQLKTYCEIMDVPIKVIYQSKDISEAMDEYRDKELILVDTAGRSHRDKMRLMELQNILRGLGEQQTFLVISATTNYKNCLDIMDSYSFLEDYRLLITKIDENVTNGIILNLALKSGKPLSYITTGQNVPDDIEKVDGERIASLILNR